jgi:hypothetical protein
VTGAPLYLVSACTSGEEFVAAFRRYADKNGLFIPIGEPLQIGRRARFAVTLRDGGVMIEGCAEVISSARTASVLHGRVGMTLRFLEPDEASQTTLGELERARLAMRPAPPSIPPRPAEIPAEPRPVPPPVQGRIDAVNALAQCVAIGDPDPPPPPPPIATPRARTKSMPPASPGIARPGPPLTPTDGGLGVAPMSAGGTRFGPPLTPTETGLGIAPRGPMMPRPSNAPPPAPAASPRATPQPDALRPRADAASAAAPAISAISSGPTSDTFVAVVPPAPPAMPGPLTPGPTSPTGSRQAAEIPAVLRAPTLPGTAPPIAPSRTTTRPGAAPAPAPPPSPVPRPSAAPVAPPREGPISATLTAVPIPSTTPGSAPTEVGGILVEPLPSSDPAIAIVATAVSDDASARTQVQGRAPSPEPLEPSPPIVAAPRSALLEIEIAEPTDISQGPPEPPADLSPCETSELPPPLTIELPSPDAVEPSLDGDEPSLVDEPPRPRKTALGFAAVPAPVVEMAVAETASAPPEASTSAQVTAVIAAAGDEAIGSDGVTPGAPATGVTAPMLPPEARFQPAVDELTPSEGWTMPPDNAVWPRAGAAVGGYPATDPELQRETVSMRTPRSAAPGNPRDLGPPTGDVPHTSETLPPSDTLPPTHTLPPRAPDSAPPQPPILPGGALSSPAGAAAALPSGDWLIARDPNAPDGWSAPFQTITPPPYADGRTVAPLAANAPIPDAEPRGQTLRGNEIAVEPKVQIDPTLIEPIPVQPFPMQPVSAPPIATQTMPAIAMLPDTRLRPMPSDGSQQAMPLDNPFADSVVSSPGLAGYGAPPAAIEAPPMNMMMAVAQSSPFLRQQAQAAMQAGPATTYPGPDYQMAGPDYQMAAMTGVHDPRFASDAALPAQAGQRRVIIVLVSALVAAVIGIAILLALGDSRDTPASGSSIPHRERSSIAPPKPPATAPTQPSPPSSPEPALPATVPAPGAPPAPAASGAPGTAPGDQPAAAAAAAPIADPPTAGACFADVASVPAGAEILIDQTHVIGTTPQKVALPCGKPIELVIRKAKLVAATRTVTPTREGARLRVALAKPTFLVKVSSTPAGATISLNGRSLGVTPTTVKVPAFESSVLMIVKDGFATETETVAPRSNGLAVHAELKRLERGERKKPW